MLLQGIIIKGNHNNSTLSNLTSTLNTYRQSGGRSVGHTGGFRTAANRNRVYIGISWAVKSLQGGLSANRIAAKVIWGGVIDSALGWGEQSVIGGIVTEGRRETFD